VVTEQQCAAPGQRRRSAPAAEWTDARLTAAAAAPLLAPVEVLLGAAVGRRLAAPLASLTALPAFDTAAMDGWAVRGPGPWRVVGRTLAGGRPAGPLAVGEAVEVATGAEVPPGSDGVLPYEVAVLVRGELTGELRRGRHVRWTGEECTPHTALLDAGTLLTPAAVALAAALGHDSVLIQARPRVAALVTGDELLQRGLPGSGRIRDAVGPLLMGLVGQDLVALDHVRDDADLLREAVSTADADVVVTTGASSVGRADHLPAVLRELRADVLIHGVAVKPGHPQVLARLPDGRLLVGLPGNPLAALCAVVTLVRPLLDPVVETPVALAEPVERDLSAHRLLPVRRDGAVAALTGHAGAAMLRGAAVADGFAAVAPGHGTTQRAMFTPF
jgi:molybdopterin molybdotransferase